MSRRERTLLTPAQVAKIYDTDVATVRRWLRKGVLAHVLVGPFQFKRIPKDEAKRHFKPRAGARS